MSLSLVATIWDELKNFIPLEDRSEAADSMVMAMIDDDYDAGDIKHAFRGDQYVKEALASHTDDDSIDEEWDEEDEEEEDEY